MPPEAQAGNGQQSAGGNQGQQPATPPANSQQPNQPQSQSIYEQAGIDEPGREGSATWPQDWREQMFGKEHVKRGERYSDPMKVGNALISLQNRLSSGEFKAVKERPVAGADGQIDPEALKTWKTDQGLPVEATAYEVPLIEGLKVEDLDDAGKARIGVFQEAFFNADMTPAQVKGVMEVYNAEVAKVMEAQAVNDARDRDAVEDALRAEWPGQSYRQNMTANKIFLTETFGADVAGALLNARDGEGRLISNNPAFSRAINQLARAGGMDTMEIGEQKGGTSIEDQIKEINTILETDRSKYYREGLDKKKEKLLEQLERRGRSAPAV